MKLLALSIENARKIKAAKLDFDGKHLIQIRGENGAGKTTILDCIKFLLTGSKDIPDNMVTIGQDKSTIIGQVDDYIIRKVIKANGGDPILTIKKEGTPGNIGSPQNFLDKISGKFFDPEEFMRKNSKEKREALLKHTGIDTAAIDAKIKKAEEDRTLASRELKTIGNPQPVEKVDNVSITELLAEKERIEAFNNAQAEKNNKVSEAITNLRNELSNIIGISTVESDLNFMMDLLQRDIDALNEKFRNDFVLIALMSRGEQPLSIAEVDQKLKDADKLNAKAQDYTAYINQKTKYDAKLAEHKKLDELVDALRKEKADMFVKAAIPIDGLSLTETGVSLRGVTDENWSTSESLRVALTLAVHFSGELKTVYIKRSESLDAKSIAKIKEFAEAKDFQVIIEIVDNSYAFQGDGVFYIEEGQIVSDKKEVVNE